MFALRFSFGLDLGAVPSLGLGAGVSFRTVTSLAITNTNASTNTNANANTNINTSPGLWTVASIVRFTARYFDRPRPWCGGGCC
jgi:hypothetical protein